MNAIHYLHAHSIHTHFRRSFVVTTEVENNFLTARAHPRMLLIKPNVVGNKLVLNAPDMPTFELDIDRLKQAPSASISIWHQSVDSVDCGDEMAVWISRSILGEDVGLRLAYYPKSYPTRQILEKNSEHMKITPADAGSYADTTAYMIINQGSIDDLNQHMDHHITPLQFRPNFVVKGPGEYEEDGWEWIRIGDNVVFRCIKPCTR